MTAINIEIYFMPPVLFTSACGTFTCVRACVHAWCVCVGRIKKNGEGCKFLSLVNVAFVYPHWCAKSGYSLADI